MRRLSIRRTGNSLPSYLRDDAASVPPRSKGSGYHFENHRLEVSQEVVLHGEALGTLQIVSDMRHWDARLKRYTSIVFILMFGAAGVAFLFSSKLQAVISRPILDLERTMRTVSSHKNFALRAPKPHDDEVGALIDGFNTMLSEIQQRDTALQAANEDLQARTRELEQEIAERLRAQEELKCLNATLEQRVAERSAAAEQRSLELARSQHALEKQTRILQSILNSMSDGVIVADEAGRFILFNPAAESILHCRLAEAPTETWSAALRLPPARCRHAVPGRRVPAREGDSRARRRGGRRVHPPLWRSRRAVGQRQRHSTER